MFLEVQSCLTASCATDISSAAICLATSASVLLRSLLSSGRVKTPFVFSLTPYSYHTCKPRANLLRKKL